MADVRRKLNLMLLDDGAGLILDIIASWPGILASCGSIGRQMCIIGFRGGLLAEGITCSRALVGIALSDQLAEFCNGNASLSACRISVPRPTLTHARSVDIINLVDNEV